MGIIILTVLSLTCAYIVAVASATNAASISVLIKSLADGSGQKRVDCNTVRAGQDRWSVEGRHGEHLKANELNSGN